MDRREIRSLGLVVLAISMIYLSQINESLYMYPQLSRDDGYVFNRPQYYNTATSNSIARSIDFDDKDDEEEEYDREDEDNDDETSQPNTNHPQRKRPYFVLHVGPPKTATTTIQHGFKQNRQVLARDDNLIYLGSLPSQNNRNRMIRYEDPRNNHTQTSVITFPMSEFFPRPSEIFSRTLQYHAEHSNHVVLSAEHYTSRFPAVAKILHTIYDLVFLQKGDSPIIPLSPEEAMQRYRKQEKKKVSFKVPKEKDVSHLDVWTKDTSDQFAFDVKIVTSYRHYWEWLPSFYYQWELFNKMSAKRYKYVLTLREFIEAALDKLPPKYFVENDDDNDTRWDHEVFANLTNTHGTLFSYLKWSEPLALRNRVELFDLHYQQFGIGNDNQEEQIEQRGLFTNLLCQSIPAPITCDSRWNNATKVKEKRVRVKTTAKSAVETGILSDMLIRQLIIRAKESFPELGKSPKAGKGGKSQKAVKRGKYSDKFDPKQNVLWLPFGGPPGNFGPVIIKEFTDVPPGIVTGTINAKGYVQELKLELV